MIVKFGTTYYGTTEVDTETGAVSFTIDETGDGDDPWLNFVGDDGPVGWEDHWSTLETAARKNFETLEEAEANTINDAKVLFAFAEQANDLLGKKHFPPQAITVAKVNAYTAKRRAAWRESLIERIKSGDLTAVSTLQMHFGESIQLSVKVIKDAA